MKYMIASFLSIMVALCAAYLLKDLNIIKWYAGYITGCVMMMVYYITIIYMRGNKY